MQRGNAQLFALTWKGDHHGISLSDEAELSEALGCDRPLHARLCDDAGRFLFHIGNDALHLLQVEALQRHLMRPNKAVGQWGQEESERGDDACEWRDEDSWYF